MAPPSAPTAPRRPPHDRIHPPSGPRTAGAAAGTAVVAGSLTNPLTATAAATPGSDTNPLKLWYTQPATEWLQALAIGNGRLGAMVYGGTATEQLQLNEDSIWAGGPHQYDDPVGAEALPEIRRLIAEEKYLDAQHLADDHFMGRPTEQMQYQLVGDLVLAFPGITEPGHGVPARARPDHGDHAR